jgi:hypothetical protein
MAALFMGTLGACQEGGTTSPRDLGGSSDGGGGGGGGGDLLAADLMPRPAMMTTIRDLNDGKVATGTFVQVSAVVTAPVAIGSAVTQNQECLYELYIAQPASLAPTPSLHDGIVVRQTEIVARGDMMIDPSQCQARVPQVALGKLGRTSAVQVRATLQQRGSLRYLELAGGEILDRGPAPAAELPQPVDVTTQQLVSGALGMPTPAPFYDASGALVRLGRAVTLQRNATTQTWKVAPAAGGAETRINPAYLKLQNAGFMAPADGTLYSSVLGIVTIDLGGTITPRDTADLKP